MRLFTFVTRHGAYIDGFAGPQSRDHTEVDAATGACAAKLVLENRPPLLRNFWLCDADRDAVAALNEIKHNSPQVKGRTIEVMHGDFNVLVDHVLESGIITDNMATFALLDQRTFECHWATAEKLARHKQNGRKIELFYFLGTGWLDRAFGGTKDTDKIARWWGRDDWTTLREMDGSARADAFAERFSKDLVYDHVASWPIRRRGNRGGAVMYHMIHCSDHERAPKLMEDAYRITARPIEPEQINLLEILTTAPPPARVRADVELPMTHDPGLELYETFPPPAIDGLADEEAVDAMVDWFRENFEDPQQETPILDGDYNYIWGGPYDAKEQLFDAFGGEVSEELINDAVRRVERSGIIYWAPHGNRIREPDDVSPDRRYQRLQKRLSDVERLLEQLQAQPPGIGHNNPPADDDPCITGKDREEILAAIEYLKKVDPQPPPELEAEIQAQAAVLEKQGSRLRDWLEKHVVNKAGEGFGTAFGVTLGAGLAAGITTVLGLLAVALMQAAQATYAWAQSIYSIP